MAAGGSLDPPLNALSWNLKDSHVFSGSFLYIKMKEKNQNFQKWAEVPYLGGSGPPQAPYKSKLKLSGKQASLYSKEAHLNHGLNAAIQKKIRLRRAEKSSKNCLNWAKFSQYTFLTVFGRFLGPMTSDLLFDCFVETVVQMRFF